MQPKKYDRTVSTAAIIDDEGRVLMQDRRDISKFGEEWGFFGGSIEEGETKEQALIRELVEELEYEITEDDIEYVGDYQITLPNGVRAIEYLHIVKFPGFESLNQKEGKNMELIKIEDAKKLKLLSTYYQMLEDVGERVLSLV